MSGPFDSLKALGRTAVDIVHSRFDLLVIEIAEEQSRLVELILYGAIAFVCLFLAGVVVAGSVLAWLWDTPYRTLAIVVAATIPGAAGLYCGLTFAKKLKAKPKLFASSVEVLATDLEHLQ